MTALPRFGIAIAIGMSICSFVAPQSGPWRTVYADQAWYRDSPVSEGEWHGVLRPREVIGGPGARTALRYELVMNGDAIAVYAPTDAVDAFANKRVTVRGKRIASRSSDEAPELWPGAIAQRPPS